MAKVTRSAVPDGEAASCVHRDLVAYAEDRVVGSDLLCALIGPALGIPAARRSRARMQTNDAK